MNGHQHQRSEERGTAFVLVTIFVIVTVVFVGAFLSTSLAKVRHVNLQSAKASSFNAAESGLNAIVADVWNVYRGRSTSSRVPAIDVLDGKHDEGQRRIIAPTQIGDSSFDAQVVRVVAHGQEYADVEFEAHGWNRSARTTLAAAVRFDSRLAEVFDHAYFINNFGWLWGAGITVNGSVRSSGNFNVQNPIVNGDIVASANEELSALGTIVGTSRTQTIGTYTTSAPSTARPTNPSAPSEDLNKNGKLDAGEDKNGNGKLDLYGFPDGYDGASDRSPGQPLVEMPYLGNMEPYRVLAREKAGTLSVGSQQIFSGVFGDDSSEGVDLILVGTLADPIVIDGPVVIENDVVLKGYITGQGTIYAGRNVHVIGDLIYKNPPSWPKPMYDAAATATTNRTKDMVGLVARGSVIFGNYTSSSWTSAVSAYQKPPFTQSYIVDAADEDIGYVTSEGGDGKPRFHGDYTAHDGGKKETKAPDTISGTGTGLAYFQKKAQGGSRRYYESSFLDSFLSGLCTTDVNRVDAILYTNHMISGRVGALALNGTLVGRDEAIIFTSTITMTYDLRALRSGYQFIDIWLPRTPTMKLLYWREAP